VDDPDLKELYYEQFPEDRPKPRDSSVLGNIRTGFGHLMQVPLDIAYRKNVQDLLPDEFNALADKSFNVGNSVAGHNLATADDSYNKLLNAIRDAIRGSSGMETFGGQRATTHTP
jgi:uncharacterized protein (UPF0297 family)